MHYDIVLPDESQQCNLKQNNNGVLGHAEHARMVFHELIIFHSFCQTMFNKWDLQASKWHIEARTPQRTSSVLQNICDATNVMATTM